jgi:hypothetical protein
MVEDDEKKRATEANAPVSQPRLLLKGRWRTPTPGSSLVGPEAFLDFMLIEDSFANVVILTQQTP